MNIVRIVFSVIPVPLNQRYVVVPVYNGWGVYGSTLSNKQAKRKRPVTHELRLSYRYSSWMKKETKILAVSKEQNGLPTFTKDCLAVACFTPPKDGHHHDIDGIFKGPMDVLTRSGMVKDDWQIKQIAGIQTNPHGTGSFVLYLAQTEATTRKAQAIELLDLTRITIDHEFKD